MDMLIVTTSFPQYPGDYSGIFIYNQIKPLIKKHNIHVVYLSRKHRLSQNSDIYLHPIQYPFKTFPLSQLNPIEFYKIPSLYKRLAETVKTIVSAEHIEIVHSHWLVPTGYIVSRELPSDVPHIITAHGTDVNKLLNMPLANKIVKKTLDMSNRIIAVSRALKLDITKKTGISADKISTIYNGVNTALFRPPSHRQKSDRFRILYVGSLFKVKRVDRLIRGIRLLNEEYEHKDILKVVIVGDGPEREHLEKLSQNIRDIVHFEGKQPYYKIPEYMKNSDVLVLPSMSEGFPSVVVEALACGLPVIASNVGGIHEAVIHEKTGYLINNNVQYESVLSKFLAMYLEDYILKRKHSRLAYTHAQKNFSVDVISKKIEYLYRNVTR